MQLSKDDIKNAINEVLTERDRIDAISHADHHQFIAILMSERKLAIERNEAIKKKVYGWGIISAIGGFLGLLGTLAWHAAENYFKAVSGG